MGDAAEEGGALSGPAAGGATPGSPPRGALLDAQLDSAGVIPTATLARRPMAVLHSRWWLLLLVVWLPLHFAPLFSASELEDNGDICELFWPGHVFAAREMQAGRMPLWNPYQFGGTAFHAGMQAGVAYPPNWPLRLVGDPERWGVAALNTSRLAHLALLAGGIAWLVGAVFGCGWAAGVMAAIAFAGSGYIASHLSHLNQLQTLAWGPWIIGVARMLAIEGGGAEGWRAAVRRTILLAVLMAAALLAGHPQNLYYILGFCALMMPAWLWRAAGARSGFVAVATKRVAWFVGAGALALGLAAVQVLPTITATRLAWTAAEGRDYALHLAMPPIGFLGYVAPLFFGRAAEPDSWRYADWAFHEFGLYFGIVPLLLAIGAAGLIVVRRRDRDASSVADAMVDNVNDITASRLEVASLFCVWLVTALVAAGDATPLWGLAYDALPMFGSLRAHARTLLPGHFALVILAGGAMAVLLRLLGDRLGTSKTTLLAMLLIVVTVIDLFVASRGADFRHMETFEPTLDTPITRAIDAQRAAEGRVPGRLFWMIRDDLYFARGAGAHALRASQLTPNNNTAARVELTHGYGESLQPTLRYRDFLYTFNRNFYNPHPDVDLLRLMGVEWVLSDIDAPLDFGAPPVATMLRPGAAPLRLWRVEPMPRVLSDGEIASWSARLGLDIAEGLSRLDGFARQTGTPIPGRNTAPIDWKPDPRAFPLQTETTTVDDSNHQPTKQRREADLSSVMLETSDDPARQPFVIVGAPARELHFLMGAFPGWVLRALPPRGEPMATPPSLPAGLAIEPVSAVAWRVSTAPDAPLPPGRYEFAYAGHHVRAGARLSVAALILLVIFGAIALARRRAPAP